MGRSRGKTRNSKVKTPTGRGINQRIAFVLGVTALGALGVPWAVATGSARCDPACNTPDYYKDHFNQASYGNQDGTLNWATDWMESDEGDQSTQDPSFGSVRIWDGKLKLHGTSWVRRSADLSGAETASLSYRFETVGGIEPEDTVIVKAKPAGGTWNEITRYNGRWCGTATHDLSSYISGDTQIKFYIQPEAMPGGYAGGDEYFTLHWVKLCVTEGEVDPDCNADKIAPVLSEDPDDIFLECDRPFPCGDCDGGVTSLTLVYNGAGPVEVVVFDADATYFADTVTTGEPFSFEGTRSNGRFQKNELTLTVNGVKNAGIHVSCSQSIAAGMEFGSFMILSGVSRNGGPLCNVNGEAVLPPIPTVTATDNRDGDIPVMYAEEVVKDTDCALVVLRTWTATDDCGNQGTATQVLTRKIDTIGPRITGGVDITLTGDGTCEAAVPVFDFDVSDSCDSEVVVVQDPPPGAILTGPGVFTVTRTATDDCGNVGTDTVKITVECLAELGDTVWLDGNANGVQDPGEEGVPGVTVILETCDGEPVADRMTDGDGRYRFTDLVPGSYRVTFLAPGGRALGPRDQGGDDGVDSDASPVSGATECIGLVSGDENLTVDAGLVPPGGIDLVKNVHPDYVVAPTQVVAYTFNVVNPGGSPVTNVQVVDDACGPLVFEGGDANGNDLLEAGEVWMYACERTYQWDVPMTFTNEAMVTGVDLIGNPVTDVDTAVVTVVGVNVEKIADTEVACTGDEVTYTLVTRIRNGVPGIELRDLEVVDDKCGPLAMVGGDTNNDGLLQFGEEFTNRCVLVLTETTTNVATDSATAWFVDPGTGEEREIGPVAFTNQVVVEVVRPDIDVAIDGGVQTVTEGDTVVYALSVTNIGTTAIETLTADHSAQPDCNAGAVNLAPGEVFTSQCRVADVQMSFVDTIAVLAEAGPGCSSVFAAEVRINVVPRQPDCVGIPVRVFFDENNDGTFVPGLDSGFEGVAVQLVDAGSGVEVAAGVTGADGSSDLAVSQAGVYRLVVDEATLPEGFVLGQSFANPTDPVEFDPFGDACPDVMVAYRSLCDVCGVVWFDGDADGVPDENLTARGINQATVMLMQGGELIAGTVSSNGICGRLGDEPVDGVYAFSQIPDGSHVIVIDLESVPSDLSAFFDEEPDRAVTPRQATTAIAFDLACGPLGPNAPQPPDFGFVQEPTAVELVSLEARSGARGVVVRWVTAIERENLGFNVYRCATADGTPIRVNASLILGQGSSFGGTYEYVDAGDSGTTWYYWIEDIDWNMLTTRHGPAVVDGAVVLAEVHIDDDMSGICRVTGKALAAAGVEVPAERLSIAVDGREVAALATIEHGPLAEEDEVLFHLPAGATSIRIRSLSDPLRMERAAAPPVFADSEIWMGSASDEGVATMPIESNLTRHMVIGFRDSPVYLFDVSEPHRPRVLTEFAVLEVDDELGIYFSYPASEAGSCLAVDAEGILDIEPGPAAAK